MNHISLILLLGCASQTKDSAESGEDTAPVQASDLEFDFENRLMLTEQLGDCLSAAVVDDYLHLCATESGAELRDERDGSATVLGAFTDLAGVRTADSDILLALDGETYTYDAGVLTPLSLPISVPITEISRVGDTLWLWGGGRLFRWADETVSEIALADYPTIYGFAAFEDRLFLSVPWLIEATVVDGTLQVQSVGQTPVMAMAADASDTLWFVAESELFLQRIGEQPRRVELPEAVSTVKGPAIWVRGITHAYRYDQARLSKHRMRGEGWLGVDGYGRLLQNHDGSLQRHSIDRPVVIIGLSESLLVQQTVQLLPSDPQSVSDLQVWLDSTPLEVSTDPWTVQLDPETLSQGAHRLRIFCESELGDSQDEHPVWIGELPEVSWAQIDAISQAHCISCHGGATLTDLSTRADWERRIDAIIYQASSHFMPPDGPYLSEEQIAMIRGWKDGGFQ